jgi:hypothetical protein
MKPKTVGRADREKLDPAGQMAQHASRIPGLMLGAKVLTLNGEFPIQGLVRGDKLITRDSGTALIRAIHKQVVFRRVVKIGAGSLSRATPEDDVILVADQTVLLRDWRARAMFRKPQAIAAAGALVDGRHILDLGSQNITLFQIICDAPHIFYAQGLELGTSDVLAEMPKTRIAA